MRDDCATCKTKLKGPRFSCYICSKKLHLTPECTMFTKEEIIVLIKLDANLLHICNDCKPKKKELVHHKATPSSISNPSSSKLDEQLNKLQEQMKELTLKMESSSDAINLVQQDIKFLKEKPSSYRAAVGNVKPGRVVNQSTPKTGLGIRVRGYQRAKD